MNPRPFTHYHPGSQDKQLESIEFVSNVFMMNFPRVKNNVLNAKLQRSTKKEADSLCETSAAVALRPASKESATTNHLISLPTVEGKPTPGIERPSSFPEHAPSSPPPPPSGRNFSPTKFLKGAGSREEAEKFRPL
ncbi:hypothetical protein CEXT_694361 [Caerostris extrusa]|uniref:Uncharacterized protein n=1 Tax=Caerostris extrusa TaxID=172846 RepID=A0AAV4Y0I3_CAEEX|nr:hypothetical protein CEXT_694361 [Caerostris extrusa]